MILQATIEQDLRRNEPGHTDEVYRDQARRYMGAILGSKMASIIRGIFGDDLVNIIDDARRSDKKVARELVYTSTMHDVKKRIFRKNRNALKGFYPALDDALRTREIQELMKTVASESKIVHKSELASAKHKLGEARAKGRPRSEAWSIAHVERIKRSGRILPIVLRGGPRTLTEYELFLAHFT
jgi:hypothetical protein